MDDVSKYIIIIGTGGFKIQQFTKKPSGIEYEKINKTISVLFDDICSVEYYGYIDIYAKTIEKGYETVIIFPKNDTDARTIFDIIRNAHVVSLYRKEELLGIY